MSLAESDVDIAALVEDMPAKACECPSTCCPHGSKCDHEVKWIARGHVADGVGCQVVRVCLCDFCLTRARRIATRSIGGTCTTCGLTIKSVDDIIGSVMPV